MKKVDVETNFDLSVHLILDTYGAHKHPDVKQWFADHPRYRLHFTPTSASWLNQVERWFAEITRKRTRRGTFHSVRELEKAIRVYIRDHNKTPQPSPTAMWHIRIRNKNNFTEKCLLNQTAICGAAVRTGRRQSMPSSSIEIWARVSDSVPLSTFGRTKAAALQTLRKQTQPIPIPHPTTTL